MPCARKHEFCDLTSFAISRQRSQLSDADSIEEPEPLAPAPLLAIGGEPSDGEASIELPGEHPKGRKASGEER